MRLNHQGIYRVIGEKFELLANVEGEAPLLSINEALLINDLVKYGRFTILNSNSTEVQQVLTDPDKFVFLEYDYSEIAKLPPYRKSIRGSKMPNITDEEMKEFEDVLKHDMIVGRGTTRTKAYIMDRTSFSLAQINVLILQLCKRMKMR